MFMKRDVESGGGGERPLYPTMLENPQLRWSFIRKVYSILTFQLLLTIAVAAVVVFVRPISHFIVSTTPGLVLYILLIFVPFISTSFHSMHAFNLFFYFLQTNYSFFLTLCIVNNNNVAALCPLYYYHQKHPLNYFLLFIFTVTLAFSVGLTCAFTSGNVSQYPVALNSF